MPNLKMSFSDTHMQLNHGGWSREITVRDLPIATTLAGVNMSLTPGGVRELHWHQQAEWAYMIWGRRELRPWMQAAEISSRMWGLAIYGIFPPVSPLDPGTRGRL